MTWILSRGHKLTAASRTHESAWASELLKLLDVYDLFHYLEIYPGPKIHLFKRLNQISGLPYNNMIFFDDEMRKVQDIQALGVRAVLVENGIKKEHLSRFL